MNANAVREKGFVKEANPVLKTVLGFMPTKHQQHQQHHLHLDPPHLVAVVHSGAKAERNRAGEKKVVVVVEKKLFYEKIGKCTGVKSEAAVTAAAAATLVSRSYTSNYKLPWLPWL